MVSDFPVAPPDDVIRCLEHRSPQTFCAVTSTWSASHVMNGCGCVFVPVTMNGITARVMFQRVRARKPKAKVAA